jgi:hypothetical protein
MAARSRVIKASVTTGSTTFWARATVVVRASVIASRSPTRRLATVVANATIAIAMRPATVNWPTDHATVHRPLLSLAGGFELV